MVTEVWESKTIRDFRFYRGVAGGCEAGCLESCATWVSAWDAVDYMRKGNAMLAKAWNGYAVVRGVRCGRVGVIRAMRGRVPSTRSPCVSSVGCST